MKRWVIGVALALGLSLTARGDDWPQWMGPNRDGVWKETGIVKKFPNGGPKKLWSVKVAGGYAGPAVGDADGGLARRFDLRGHGVGAGQNRRRLRTDSSRAERARARNGLVRKSSAPSWKTRTSLSSSPFAVRTMTGIS